MAEHLAGVRGPFTTTRLPCFGSELSCVCLRFRWMAALSFLNFNFELMRPECAGEFGALQKVQVALYIPLFAAVVIAVYILIKMITLSSGSAAHRQAARHYLWRKVVTAVRTSS